MPEPNLFDDLFRGVVARLENIEARLGELNLLESPSLPLSLADAADVAGILPQVNLGASGAWTPVFAGTTIAGVYTYAIQEGTYYRIGNLVFLRGNIQISAIGTPPTGNMNITGLPYAAANLGSTFFGLIGNFNYAAAAIELTADITASTIRLIEAFDNGANVAAPAANFTNVNCHLEFGGFYQPV